ncbi:Aste57867_8369 [Aphanomyces stellatus]|uniref:Aste57867_8369 protein n=1 Tax=Aphanomyces stellatus TaxID=120398 RepID=A0A485KK42_9STRA|nr:hypothetical protein As57867_008337 [Aphanomyces stellatus]VFT85255.1 Aste57867_8369 [Aphanomyces stellatus]
MTKEAFSKGFSIDHKADGTTATSTLPQGPDDDESYCIQYQYSSDVEEDDDAAVAANLESLLEMDLDIYVESEEAPLGFDPCVSLETLALQSPHGSSNVDSRLSTWQEEGENNEVDADPATDTASDLSGPEWKQDRRRLSLRKGTLFLSYAYMLLKQGIELFQHRIKAQDLSSPGPKNENNMTSRYPSLEQPEYDLASPLHLPPSPTSFRETPTDEEDTSLPSLSSSSLPNNQDDVKQDMAKAMMLKTSPKEKPKLAPLRGRKVKHGGIYSLLLKGVKRTDDDAAVLVDKDISDGSGASMDTQIKVRWLSQRTSPSPSKMQVRHGGIYRMLREKT